MLIFVLFGVLQACGVVLVFLVFFWWCQDPVSTSGPRTRTCRCFAKDCGFVVVFLWCCPHPARELVLFGVLQDCGGGGGVFCGGVVVFLWW